MPGCTSTRPLPTPCRAVDRLVDPTGGQAVRGEAGPACRIRETVYAPAAPVIRPPPSRARTVTRTEPSPSEDDPEVVPAFAAPCCCAARSICSICALVCAPRTPGTELLAPVVSAS